MQREGDKTLVLYYDSPKPDIRFLTYPFAGGLMQDGDNTDVK